MEEGDIKLRCVDQDCGREFVFTVNEQKFFEEMKFGLPKRCPEHRKRARARNDEFKRKHGELSK